MTPPTLLPQDAARLIWAENEIEHLRAELARLRAPDVSADMLAEAGRALVRMEARKDENIDEWAAKLAADFVAAGEGLRAPAGDAIGADMPEDTIIATQARRILLHGTGVLSFDDLIAVTLYPLIHEHDPWTQKTLEKVWARQYPYCLYINGRRFRVPFRYLVGSQIAGMVSNGNYQLLDGKDKPIALNTYVDLESGKEPLHFFTVPPCRE